MRSTLAALLCASAVYGAFPDAPRAMEGGSAPPPSNPAPADNAPAGPVAIEIEYWRSIVNSTDPADFEAYLNRFPSGNFTELARNRLARLRAAPAVPASPFAGKWLVQAKDALGFAASSSTWELTIEGGDVQVKGEMSSLKFKQGHVDGDKITLDWSKGTRFEGTLVNPKRIEGRWHAGLFSNAWWAEKQ